MYTLVPDHVRCDLDWMAGAGASVVAIGILEQDFTAARENIDFVCQEAEKRGMEVWAVPSRWGNLVAGCPKVPSILSATLHDCWALNRDGKPCMGFLGPYASVHATQTQERFRQLLEQTLSFWPMQGIIWDEPKALRVCDFSAHACRALADKVDDVAAQLQAQAGFFGKLNRLIHSVRPEIKTLAFVYANLPDDVLRAMAAIDGLDIYGCDGRPWSFADRGPSDCDNTKPAEKLLIDHGGRFIAAARKHSRNSMALIENHALPASALPLMERRLPEIIAMGWDWLFYYYFPRSCQSPERNMDIIKRALT